MKPAGAFAAVPAPAAADYDQASSWAARPDTSDLADVTPAGVSDEQARARADVFFVHPTTYWTGDSWNQPLSDASTNQRTDRAVLRNQASVFNTCCRVFVPRYRQAILYSFFDDAGEDGLRARDLAYEDVRRAFDHFLAHDSQDRPLILAGHSQGAMHALRLLEERVAGKPLQDRLVAAYVIGWAVPLDKLHRTLQGIRLCSAPDQVGCLVTYNTFEEDASRERFGKAKVHYPTGYESMADKAIACVNPLSWRGDAVFVEPAANPGAVQFGKDRRPGVDQSVSAQCVGGLLEISKPPHSKYRGITSWTGNYHIYDFQLFHMSLRFNAEKRVQAFLQEHPRDP